MAKIIQLYPLLGGSNEVKKEKPQERYKRRKDGLYQLEKRYVMPDGSQKKKSFYGKTQAETTSKRKAFERELEAGKNLDALGIKISSYVSTYLEIFKADVEKNTLRAYKHDAGLLIEKYGQKKVQDITLSDVQSILNSRAGLSKSSVKKTAALLRSIFEAARADRIITSNPCDKLVLPYAEEGTHRAITEEERILITDNCKDHKFHLAAMLMLYAGLRRGEALAINIDRDVDLRAGTISIKESIHFEGNKSYIGSPKTEAGVRTIPILPPLRPLLEKHTYDRLALYDNKGNYVSSSAFKNALRSYKNSMEAVMNGSNKRWADENTKQNWKQFNIRCHDLRHTFCTMLYDAGVDVKTAQAWMGHDDVSMTMGLYTHLSAQKQDIALKAANDHFEAFVGKYVGKSQYGEDETV